ncbi:MAG: FeoB-associated Cys-rich membrane protein [Clostridia bacterium]|nr:FeoB-associated Cys-rich membrane protein [Clostridia bacterium]
MQIIEILVIILAVGIVLGVLIKSILDVKNGKCSCGCSDCPHSSYCHKKKQKETDNK